MCVRTHFGIFVFGTSCGASERVFKRASVVPLLWGRGGQVPSERGMECVRVNVWMFVCSLVQCAHSDFRCSMFSAPGKSNKIRLVVVYLKICVTVYYISHLTNVFL